MVGLTEEDMFSDIRSEEDILQAISMLETILQGGHGSLLPRPESYITNIENLVKRSERYVDADTLEEEDDFV
jgi:hypothetical protein